MVQYLAAGMSPDQAVRAMQKMTALEPEQLQAFVPQALRIFNRKNVQVRHRSMVLLARKGLTDKTIAKRFINPRTGKNYHAKAVNRIVNKNWKLAENPRQKRRLHKDPSSRRRVKRLPAKEISHDHKDPETSIDRRRLARPVALHDGGIMTGHPKANAVHTRLDNGETVRSWHVHHTTLACLLRQGVVRVDHNCVIRKVAHAANKTSRHRDGAVRS